MLEIAEFKAERFKKEEDYNVIDFTENTIILCKNCKLMHGLTGLSMLMSNESH